MGHNAGVQVTVQVLSALFVAVAIWAAALWLMIATDRRSRQQAAAAEQAAVRGRRVDFELGTLRELVDAAARGDVVRLGALVTILPAADVGVTRASVGLPAPEAATRRVAQRFAEAGVVPELHGGRQAHLSVLQAEILDELLTAINARLGG
jgi:hypothetical protein